MEKVRCRRNKIRITKNITRAVDIHTNTESTVKCVKELVNRTLAKSCDDWNMCRTTVVKIWRNSCTVCDRSVFDDWLGRVIFFVFACVVHSKRHRKTRYHFILTRMATHKQKMGRKRKAQTRMDRACPWKGH